MFSGPSPSSTLRRGGGDETATETPHYNAVPRRKEGRRGTSHGRLIHAQVGRREGGGFPLFMGKKARKRGDILLLPCLGGSLGRYHTLPPPSYLAREEEEAT